MKGYCKGNTKRGFCKGLFEGHPKGSIIKAPVLGGSWAVISGFISRVTLLLAHVRGLITTHEPPSRGLKNYQYYFLGGGSCIVIIAKWAPKPYSNY